MPSDIICKGSSKNRYPRCFWFCYVLGHKTHREVDPNGLILTMDFIRKVIKKSHNGGLLQRHGRTEARAYNGWPCQSNAFPVMQIGQTHSTVISQKTVQGTLEIHRIYIYASESINTFLRASKKWRGMSYLELLLSDTAVVWVEELKDMGDHISAAEIVGSQCSEQHILSSAAYLQGHQNVSFFKHI